MEVSVINLKIYYLASIRCICFLWILFSETSTKLGLPVITVMIIVHPANILSPFVQKTKSRISENSENPWRRPIWASPRIRG